MPKSKTKAIPEKQLPAITSGKPTLKFLDAAITYTRIITHRHMSFNDNVPVDVLAVTFTRLFRVDDQFDESDHVVLSDDVLFTFCYEIEIKPSDGNLYSQLLTAAFHGKEMPVSEFSLNMLDSKWVRLVIEDERYLSEIRPLTDTSAIDKDQ